MEESVNAVFKKTIYLADDSGYSKLKVECKNFHNIDDAINEFRNFVDNEELEIPFT